MHGIDPSDRKQRKAEAYRLKSRERLLLSLPGSGLNSTVGYPVMFIGYWSSGKYARV